MKRFNFFLILVISFTALISWGKPSKILSNKEVVDGYAYFIARALVLRQEQLDFKEGFKWNELKHRDIGGVEWANPNLDVTYSEGWVAIDNNTCTMVEVPEIKDRYYTVQVLNGWGETTANINERTYAKRPHGKFALCLKQAKVVLPENVQRINLPSKKSRILSRVEVGKDPKAAMALQHQIRIYSTGTPEIAESPKVTEFEHSKLPGIEIFDNAANVLASEKDINPGMGGYQRMVLAIEGAGKDKNFREGTDITIKEKAIPAFLALSAKFFDVKNGWGFPKRVGNYGSNFQARSFVNYVGIWANNSSEAIYMTAATDAKGTPLEGNSSYSMTFPKDKLPDSLVRYFWSITAVDAADFKAIPNPLNKHVINNVTDLKKNPDGSLTLYFSSKIPEGVNEGNWLPVAAGKPFHLTFRFYGGNKNILAGKYSPPGLIRSTQLASAE